jgi:hypothetical protein
VKASAVLIATGLAFAAGCSGDGDGDEQKAQGRPPAKLGNTTALEGGPARERALLQRVVDGMEKTTLTRIVIRRTETRPDGEAGSAVAATFTAAPGPSVRRQWDQWIVAGAFSRRLDAAGLPAEVDGVDRHGSFTAKPRLPGQPDPGPLSRGREAAIVKGIRRAARRSGADLVSLEVHRPYGAAVALSLRAEDPARFLKANLRPLIRRLDVDRRRVEGIYLAVLDDRRRLALEWASWTRNRAGTYWVRRDLAKCSPIAQSEPPGTEPAPPCPV